MSPRASTSSRKAGEKALSGQRKEPSGPCTQKRLWIFDFDNTIARLEPEVDWAGSRRELEPMLRADGVPEELFELHPRRNLPLYEATRSLLLAEWDGPCAQAEDSTGRRTVSVMRRASSIIEKHELAGVDRAMELEGAMQLIRDLKRAGSMIAIVTSNSSRPVRRWLTLHGMSRMVKAIVGRDSLLALKPSPAMVRLALGKCDATPTATAFVGDAISDFEAATALGIDFYAIAAKPGSRDALVAAGASRIFSSPAALAIYLNLPGASQAPRAKA